MSYEAWGEPDDDRFEAAKEAGWLDPNDLSKALIDVMKERDRQWNEEGFTPEHDDKHFKGEIAIAATCYALNAGMASKFVGSGAIPATRIETLVASCPPAKDWPWDRAWWKPSSRRRDLVKACALIIAEIERLDRIAEKGGDVS